MATHACSADKTPYPVIDSNDFTQKISSENIHLNKSAIGTQNLFPLADLVETVQQSVVSIS
ncbi:uncharacterized protein METZ01_LOCUS217429, partial [marine metagenome]